MNLLPRTHIPKMVNTAAENTASNFYKKLKREITEFEEGLSEDFVVGIRLINFGQMTFTVSEVGYNDPSLIIFIGEYEGGPVRLVQHVSQINMLLMALKPQVEEKVERRQIGFIGQVEE